MAEGLDLGLVGQIGDDALVGLEAAQDIGLHQFSQRRVGDMGSCAASLLTKLAKAFDDPSKPRIEEIEDRPQIAQIVLDRRAGEDDAPLGAARI